MGCFSSKPIPSNLPALSSSEDKLNKTDLVFLVMGPAGSRTASFADAAAGVPKEPSSLTVPNQFQTSDIRVRRTAISQKQAVFIVPQEFDGDSVKEPHVVKGVQDWLTTDNGCRDHPYVDYILFLSEPTNPLGIQLESPLRYLSNLCGICDLKDPNPLYCKSKLSFIATIGQNDNSHIKVPDTWETFVKKGCPTYTFEGTSESAQNILSTIVG